MAQRAKNKPELKIVVSNTPEVPAVEPVPEQVEMPFAIVNGEPVTQMPKDLYIPPQAMEVFLEAFEGPLDLLLYLIRRQNLNILDIPLAEITRQYMKYIEVMTELQLELAGEYMVMAATLAEIKSRMLLPRPKVDPEGNEEDPRAELVRRLQEYERFKRAAEDIDALPRLERDVWQTSAELRDRKVVRLLPTVTLQEMLLAFKDVVVRSEMFAHHHIQRERLSVRERMSNVMEILEKASFVEFVRLFRVEEGRMGVTVTFMALLELVREGLIEIVQAEPFAPIHVRAAGASRKLHVVGGNEALDGEAVVVGEAVVGDAPAIGVLTSPADLDSITELVLDPNFVDDDDDEEEAPLEGVDDVIEVLSAPAPDALADPSSAALAIEPTSVADEWTSAVEPFALAAAAAVDPVASTDALDDVVAAAAADAAPTDALEQVVASATEHNDGSADVTSVAHANSLDDVTAPATVAPTPADEAWTTDVDPAALDDVAAPTVDATPAADSWTADVDPPVSTAALETVVATTTEPTAVDDDWSADVTSVASAGSLDDVTAPVAFAPTPVADSWTADVDPPLSIGALENVVATTTEPTAVDDDWSADVTSVASVGSLDDVTVSAVDPTPADAVAPISANDEWAGDVAPAAPVGAIDPMFTSAVDVAVESVPFPEPTNVAISPVVGQGGAFDVTTSSVLANAPLGVASSWTADTAPFAATDATPISVESVLANAPAPVSYLATGLDQPGVVVEQTPEHAVLSVTHTEAPAVVAPPDAMLDEVASIVDPAPIHVGEPSHSAVATPAVEPIAAADEPIVTVDPAVFEAPAMTAESDLPPEPEPSTLDVEYEASAEDLAADAQAASDDAVSLAGDTSITGDVSLVGEESTSGGPAVDVEEFAFDELPAVDEAEHADQQPAAGAPTEESDD